MEVAGEQKILGYIYALRDPRTSEVRYIGKAKDVQRRARCHLMDSYLSKEDTYKARWIRTLLRQGLEPVATVLCEVLDGEDINAAERHWISVGRNLGWPLTNATEGGDGGNTGVHVWTEEQKLRASLAQKGRKWSHDDPRREQIRRRQLGKPLAPTATAKATTMNSLHWRVTSPGGEVFDVVNLAEFCRTHGLHKSHLIAVADNRKYRTHHKGWKCKRANEDVPSRD